MLPKSICMRVAAFFAGRTVEQDLDDEIRFHLDNETAKLVRAGVATGEARRRALAAFGGVERTKELHRDGRGDRWFRDFASDVRYGWRTLVRSPVLALTGILTLALGIGATMAIFSVVNAVILRPLPFERADRLVRLWEDNAEKGWKKADAAPANMLDWKERVTAFADVAAWQSFQSRATLTGRGQPQVLNVTSVTGNFFSVLRAKPFLGRALEDRETWNTGSRVAVLSYPAWRDRFGADRDIVGRTIELNGAPVQVVGVMGPDLAYPFADVDLWRPLAFDPSDRTKVSFRRAHWMGVIARLRDGRTMESASAELHDVMTRMATEYPVTNTHMEAGLEDLHRYTVGDTRRPLLLLLGATGFLLLIACANVGNLLLVRAAAREREVVLRRALGARALRVVRQALTDALLLSALGGTAGYVLGWWGTRALGALQPAGMLPTREIAPDLRVFVFVLIVTTASAVLFGTIPAVWSGRRDPADVLKESSRTGSASRRMRIWANGLVMSEVALALLLTVGAGLMVRSLWNILHVPPGFDARNVLAVSLSLPGTRYDSRSSISGFYANLVQRTEALPGVVNAAVASRLPLTGRSWTSDFSIAGQPPSDQMLEVVHREVSPGYFRVMRVPVIAGRDFTAADRTGSLPVIIINQSLARRFFPDESPLGRRIAFDRVPDSTSLWRTVVGVVGDEHQAQLSQEPRIEIFAPAWQEVDGSMTLLLRTQPPPLELAGAVRQLVATLDPSLALYRVRDMEDVLADSMARERFLAALLLAFATVGAVLAVVGVYGVVSQLAQQRTREIGIRIALGAQAGRVRWLIVRHGVVLLAGGLVVGAVVALVATRPLGELLFGVAPHDPITFALVASLLGLSGALASAIPAWRATNAEPSETLRED